MTSREPDAKNSIAVVHTDTGPGAAAETAGFAYQDKPHLVATACPHDSDQEELGAKHHSSREGLASMTSREPVAENSACPHNSVLDHLPVHQHQHESEIQAVHQHERELQADLAIHQHSEPGDESVLLPAPQHECEFEPVLDHLSVRQHQHESEIAGQLANDSNHQHERELEAGMPVLQRSEFGDEHSEFGDENVLVPARQHGCELEPVLDHRPVHQHPRPTTEWIDAIDERLHEVQRAVNECEQGISSMKDGPAWLPTVIEDLRLHAKARHDSTDKQ